MSVKSQPWLWLGILLCAASATCAAFVQTEFGGAFKARNLLDIKMSLLQTRQSATAMKNNQHHLCEPIALPFDNKQRKGATKPTSAQIGKPRVFIRAISNGQMQFHLDAPTCNQEQGGQNDRDNRGNQLNPNNPEFGGGQGSNDNRSNQMNPNNPAYQGGKGGGGKGGGGKSGGGGGGGRSGSGGGKGGRK